MNIGSYKELDQPFCDPSSRIREHEIVFAEVYNSATDLNKLELNKYKSQFITLFTSKFISAIEMLINKSGSVMNMYEYSLILDALRESPIIKRIMDGGSCDILDRERFYKLVEIIALTSSPTAHPQLGQKILEIASAKININNCSKSKQLYSTPILPKFTFRSPPPPKINSNFTQEVSQVLSESRTYLVVPNTNKTGMDIGGDIVSRAIQYSLDWENYILNSGSKPHTLKGVIKKNTNNSLLTNYDDLGDN